MADQNALTAPERSDLRRLEGVIEKGMATFVAVGQALKEIRDNRLYREKWKTFEAYCDDRFDYGRSYANKLITAADTTIAASDLGTVVPKSERAARELAKVPEEDWQDVIDEVAATEAETGKPATAKTFKQAAEKVAEEKESEPETTKANPVAETSALIVSAASQLDKLTSELRRLAEMDGGQWLSLRLQHIEREIKQLKYQIRDEIYWVDCTDCDGKGCKECRQSGWFAKSKKAHLSQKQKDLLGVQ